jgi:NADPH-dependent 2,4-dienoyl-CoA reductase/sulfur reductase-like enzyme
MDSTTNLPVAVIGAGPVGLAAAAHLLERGLEPLIFEAGPSAGAAIGHWRHIRLFSPWRFNIDAAAVRLLENSGWEAPRPTALPYGGELVDSYLAPLAALPAISSRLLTGARVVAVTRNGLDKTHLRDRDTTPFVVRVEHESGEVRDYPAAAVIDASGTWSTRNPLGTSGLPALGEAALASSISPPLPDVLDRDRASFAGRRVLVVGAGHSAANTLISLADLAKAEPGTRIVWAVRGASAEKAYGGGDADGLPARGQLGARLRRLVEAGSIELHTGFGIASLAAHDGGTAPAAVGGPAVTVTAVDGRTLEADVVVPCTGFRPDLDILRELRLSLDPAVEAPTELAPLIDPEFHSCGTVAPHGASLLAHPDTDFYIVGMKSYGRAPTFLLATGYEQVRSVAAALAGDRDAADTVQLELPATGVCSTGAADAVEPESACCGTPEPVLVGFPTGLAHGRSGSN